MIIDSPSFQILSIAVGGALGGKGVENSGRPEKALGVPVKISGMCFS